MPAIARSYFYAHGRHADPCPYELADSYGRYLPPVSGLLQYRPVGSSRLQLHRASKSLSLAPPHRAILLVRARAYQVTVQFPKEVVQSDRRARAAARCIVNLAVIIM